MSDHKQYNLNTKYGRRKAREQAQRKYDNGTREYRDEIDRIGNYVWLVVIVLMTLVGGCIYAVGGSEALIKWLK